MKILGIGSERNKILRAEKKSQKEATNRQREKEKQEKKAVAILNEIINIVLDSKYMLAIRNQDISYDTPNGTIKKGIVLIEGKLNGTDATLAIEPVNSTINLYLRVGKRTQFIRHWFIVDNPRSVVPCDHTEDILYYLKHTDLVKRTSVRSLKRKHR